jgi:hypothetical protein
MRCVIKAKALGKETGDLSALANPESVEKHPAHLRTAGIILFSSMLKAASAALMLSTPIELS